MFSTQRKWSNQWTFKTAVKCDKMVRLFIYICTYIFSSPKWADISSIICGVSWREISQLPNFVPCAQWDSFSPDKCSNSVLILVENDSLLHKIQTFFVITTFEVIKKQVQVLLRRRRYALLLADKVCHNTAYIGCKLIFSDRKVKLLRGKWGSVNGRA